MCVNNNNIFFSSVLSVESVCGCGLGCGFLYLTMKSSLYFSFLLWAVVCLLVVVADWLDGNGGVDRFGDDLSGMPIALKEGSIARDCATMCNANPECKAWVFSKPNCGGNEGPQCYFKATVPKQIQNSCRVSLRFKCSIPATPPKLD